MPVQRSRAQDPSTLSREQFLPRHPDRQARPSWPTLATMLVRFRWFRRILLTERRDWPERLISRPASGIPLTAGVASRLLLDYDAADLTLVGRVSRRAHRRARTPARSSAPASGCRRSSRDEWAPCPSRSAAALPAAACARSVRRKRSGGSRRSSSRSLHRSAWRLLRRLLARLAGHSGHGAGHARAAPAGDRRAVRRRASSISRRRRGGCRCSCCVGHRPRASRFRSRSGTARASSTGWPSRSSC